MRLLINVGLLFLIAGFCPGCNRTDAAKHGIDDDGVIAVAESVRAWRTVGSLGRSENVVGEDFFKPSGEGVVVASELAKRLAVVLLNEKSYLSPRGSFKGCIAEPGVMIRFSKGGGYSNAFLCFECDILIVRTKADEMAKSGGVDRDFDPSRAEFVKLVKLIFPTDTTIQELKQSGAGGN